MEGIDWQRMLIGDEPPIFFLEIIIRTAIIYAYTLFLLRWLGSRAIGQLSTVEFLLVIALGSAVGDAMFYPDVPLLHCLLVVTAVVVANKLIDLGIARSKAIEHLIDGKAEQAVRDGVICSSFLNSSSLGTSELFQQLREKGVRQLGEVEHAIIEADGVLTVFETGRARPGLPILPPWEIERPKEVDRTSTKALLSCMRCGYTSNEQSAASCEHCGDDRWTMATITGGGNGD
ncbi:DUF421 domain-containing protein [Devosia sp. Root685]|uniref:DUF421 domain-containing protein n=1 Tax=Devosia sp. Root685 TaxID=1736587 RepID=UPI0009E7B6C7|nr:YetF domain-containing protein [Devosia sp. Root685]